MVAGPRFTRPLLAALVFQRELRISRSGKKFGKKSKVLSPKEMSEAEVFLKRHYGKISWVILLSAVVPSFFYKTEFDITYLFTVKYLTVPTIIVFFLLCPVLLPHWFSAATFKQRAIGIGLTSFIFVVCLGGPIIAFNSLIGHQEKFTLHGAITELRKAKRSIGKYSGEGTPVYYVTIQDKQSGEPRKFEVGRKEFLRYSVGQLYSKTWYRGSLGFIYQKKY